MSLSAPKHPCAYPGCPTLVAGHSGKCEKHRIQQRRELEAGRASATSRGYGSRWRTARKRFLELNPLCVECNRMGRLTAATVVDHIVPHKGDAELFWDQSCWQALCKPCHDRKTAREDGRWGRAGQISSAKRSGAGAPATFVFDGQFPYRDPHFVIALIHEGQG